MENKETILYRNGDVSIRSIDGGDAESRIVCGYAVKFDSDSQNIGCIEQIQRGAITEDIIMNSDIFARLDHRDDTVLARSRYGEGTLALELRDDGLYYEFEAPRTVLGDELLEHIKRGEIFSSSFAFTLPVDGSGEKWYLGENGELRHSIFKIDRLYDISPVYEPAYLETSCSKRAKEILDNSETINHKYDALMEELHKYIIE